MRYAYIFFALALLMVFFYLMGWYYSPSPVQSDNITAAATGQQNNLLPYWLSGIGTLALALFTFYLEILKPLWTRPRLSLEFKNEKPYCRIAKIKDTDTLAYYVRIKVTNTGNTVAKRCVGKLVKVMNNDGGELSDYDPAALPWVGTDIEEAPFRAIDLNKGECEYLNVVYTRNDVGNMAIIWKDVIPRGAADYLRQGQYILHIAIYIDNVKPTSSKYRLTVGSGDYQDIKLEPT